MSYILDALKKAERERDIAQVPTLMTVHDAQPEASRKKFWLICGICLVCAALLVVAGFLLRSTLGPAASQTDGERGQQRSATATPAPLPQAITPQDNTGSGTTPALSAKLSSAETVHRNPLKRTAADETRVAVPVQNSKRIELQPTRRETVQPQPTPKTVPAGVEASQAPEGSQPKPISLREAVAKMNMTVLMYSEVPSERMVFINDHRYVEGDYIDGRYLLETITLEGAVLTYQGERVVLHSKAK